MFLDYDDDTLVGFAACGNDEEDYYGRVNVSWEGNGTSSSRLKDWLDPQETGITTLEGINANDIGILTNNITVEEGDSGQKEITVLLQLTEPLTEQIDFNYTTRNDSAIAEQDFQSSNGKIVFQPGITEQALSLSIQSDSTPEDDETFFLEFVTQDSLNISRIMITILNDDYITPSILTSPTLSTSTGRDFSHTLIATNTPRLIELTGNPPAGMSIDSKTGEIRWIPLTAGTYSVEVTVTNPAGSVSSLINITVQDDPFLTGIDREILPYTNNGVSWIRTTSQTFDRIDAARSGIITNGQASGFRFDIVGPATLQYHWKVSSEEIYDFLILENNGQIIDAITGEVDWTTVTYDIPDGLNSIQIVYSKDVSVSIGADAGWIDNLSLTPQARNISIDLERSHDSNNILLQATPYRKYQVFKSNTLPSPDAGSWTLINSVATNLFGNTELTTTELEPSQFYQIRE